MIKRVEEITEALIEVNGKLKTYYTLTTCINKYIQEELPDDEIIIDIKYINDDTGATTAYLHIGERKINEK